MSEMLSQHCFAWGRAAGTAAFTPDLNTVTTGVKCEFEFPFPVDIVAYGGLVTTVIGAGTYALELNARPTRLSATAEVAYGTAIPGVIAAGDLFRIECASSTGAGFPQIDPGGSAAIEVTATGTSGAVEYFVEYVVRSPSNSSATGGRMVNVTTIQGT